MLIATIRVTSAEEALRQAREVSAAADLLEIRLDALAGPAAGSLDEWLPRLSPGAIATCRRPADGGAFEGSEEERTALLEQAARSGARFVDVEAGSDAARRIRVPPRTRRILSRHVSDGTPADLEALAAQIGGGRDVAYRKLVTLARTLPDNLRMRDLLRAAVPGPPLIAFCMGGPGRLSRLLALCWGSAATYGAAGTRPAAPGQLRATEMDELYRVRDIDAATRLAGIVGTPLGHSLSPLAHNAALAAARLDSVYLPLESEDLEAALDVAAAVGVRRLSVTLPHKVRILPLLDELEPLARRLGAVNTVIPAGERRLGLNTDARGGLAALRSRLPSPPVEVAVVGSGGAARGVAIGLAATGARVTVFHRRSAGAGELARTAGVRARPLEELERHPYDVLVNATPVGMAPLEDAMPIPPEWLRGKLVFDLVYNPRETRLLLEARRRGIATLSGLEMFLGQAAEQFELFTGLHPIEGVMRDVVEAVLGGAGPPREGNVAHV